MKNKEYKIGDRVFYEYCDGTIGTDIVLDVEDKIYLNDKGREIHYQWLKLGDYTGIENYNCLSINNIKLKEIKKQYVVFDKNKSKIIEDILNILKPFDNKLKRILLKEIEVKCFNDKA